MLGAGQQSSRDLHRKGAASFATPGQRMQIEDVTSSAVRLRPPTRGAVLGEWRGQRPLGGTGSCASLC